VGQHLIVETSALIWIEHHEDEAESLLPQDADLAIAAVTLAEVKAGVSRETQPRRLAAREAFLAAFLVNCQILDYTRATAEYHAQLLSHTQARGTARGAHDLIIAAHSAETGRAIVTLDRKARFADLPGVTVADVG
jgi:predicted nucleic acid-binding protein